MIADLSHSLEPPHVAETGKRALEREVRARPGQTDNQIGIDKISDSHVIRKIRPGEGRLAGPVGSGAYETSGARSLSHWVPLTPVDIANRYRIYRWVESMRRLRNRRCRPWIGL